MMKQLFVIAAVAAVAQAALFIQQSDFGAQFRYGAGGSSTSPLTSALFTDTVNGVAKTDFPFYAAYGIRYYNGESRGFAPTGNWLLVQDPISNNYGDYSSPVFTIPVANGGVFGTGTAWNTLGVPRNQFSTFHSVVIAAGPESKWTQRGDIVLFQPHRNVSSMYQAYNPLDVFSFQLHTGATSVQTAAAGGFIPTGQTGNAPFGFANSWNCLGHQAMFFNLAADELTLVGAAAASVTGAFRAPQGSLCLVSEDDVVALVDIAPDSGLPSPQRSLVNRLDALHSEPTEFGFTTLA